MRALFAASFAIVVASGCMAEFPELADAEPDAGTGGSSGASGGLGGQSGGGGQGGSSGGSGGSLGGAAGSGASGGAAGVGVGGASGAGAGGTAGAAGTEPAGLIGYWPFDDNVSNVVKDKAGSPPRDGSFVAGSINWASDPQFGTVLALNEGAGVSVPAWSGVEFPAVGTVSVWVKFDAETVETKNRGVFDTYDTTRDHIFMRRSNQDTGLPLTLQGGFWSASTGMIKSGVSVKVPNKIWKHVAIGWDTTTDQGLLYLGDNLVAGTIVTADLTSQPGWTPKQQNFVFGQTLIGWLAEARLYDRMLSYAELEQVGKLQNP